MCALERFTSDKTVEKISALEVVSGLEGKSADGMAVHRVAVLLVNSVVNVLPGHDGTWAEGAGNAMFVGKALSQKTLKNTISMINFGGYCSNGVVL